MSTPTITDSRIGSLVGSMSGGSAFAVQAPISSAQFVAMTGVTPTAIYLCNEASGSLVDVLGGTSLATVGSPAYAAPVGDRIGVRYPASSGHGADVGALGLASGWYAAIFRISNPALGTPAIVGRYNAAFNRCVEIFAGEISKQSKLSLTI